MYAINFHEALEIVHVIYSGVVSLNERIQAVEDVCRSYSHLRPLKILVNVRELDMDLSIREQQKLGQFLATHPGLSNARVAVLHKKSHNPNLCVDISAFNFGYVLAQFINTKQAEQWLNAK